MKKDQNRSAFALIELIFVIVVLGIVASLGSELIAQVYKSYIVQRAQHNASLKTELAALQIANRLISAIPGTVYRIKDDDSYESIESALTVAGTSYKGLQWVAADTDSFSATATPGWSGFCDIDASTATSISTPGSDLPMVATIIGNLGGTPILYFPYDLRPYPVNAFPNATTITLAGTGTSRIVEHYKLARSSYALVIEGEDLFLYYNFAPTPALAFAGASKSLLMENISTFKFKGSGRTIRFKICKEERISKDFNITSCKEKAVF